MAGRAPQHECRDGRVSASKAPAPCSTDHRVVCEPRPSVLSPKTSWWKRSEPSLFSTNAVNTPVPMTAPLRAKHCSRPRTAWNRGFRHKQRPGDLPGLFDGEPWANAMSGGRRHPTWRLRDLPPAPVLRSSARVRGHRCGRQIGAPRFIQSDLVSSSKAFITRVTSSIVLTLVVVVVSGILAPAAHLQDVPRNPYTQPSTAYYDVQRWPSNFASPGYIRASNSAIFVESPDRIYLATRGEVKLPDRFRRVSTAPSTRCRHRTLGKPSCATVSW